MNVVVDTNVLLTSISRKSKIHWVFRALLDGKYTLCVTTDILNEYAEILEQNHHNPRYADTVLKTILNLPNIKRVHTFFSWNLIPNDADDNKFVDCAVACNASYLVSYDKHFNVLANIEFPKVNAIKPEQFQEILEISTPDE